ncbi:PadR family transcriptional regulator [Bifidobacterium sp. ESL0690]|uniref:PadR family transcriptional regulator n=1 Tax=Bifidobacterium sp. ESL0690 TaxID=2983214 RepID=UPI0023F816FB|nr:PadR family transcriptional regulator [Bifidobacterium sp. ESL0690]WEV46773.1 PadR family transcriptional regulator [Bifidobacterium sp. ESL0690]
MALPSIELMTLGALKDHPMSAYDINKFLASRGVSNWVQVSEQSVYRIAIKLCDDGYTSIDTEDSSASSQKRVYSITPKGAQHFDELMNEIASAPPHITFDFVAMVANLYQTDEATGRRLLTTLETNHRSVAEWMRSSVADLPFSEASETVLLCADTYALIARWAHHFQENFYHDSESAGTNEPEYENDNNTETANSQSKSTDFVIVTPLQARAQAQNDSTEEETKMQRQNEIAEEPDGATTSNREPNNDTPEAANTAPNASTASETSASQTPNQDRPETNANNDGSQNSPTVMVKNQQFTGSRPITKLDFHLHSMAGRITTQSSNSGAFEIKFHHCKASDFQISNTAGTLHIANTGTPWDHMSLMNVFNPAQWNAYVEVIIPASQPLVQTTAALNSSSLVIAGLESRDFDLNLHSSSAKINDISADDASLATHGGSVKWDGSVRNSLNVDCHNSSARISGLPRNFGYLAEIHSSTLTVDGKPIIANRHSASRPGTLMVDVNLHSSSISLD